MTVSKEEIIKQLQSCKSQINQSSNSTSGVYIKIVDTIISKLEQDYYKKVGNSNFYNFGLNELANDLRSVGFYDLADQVLRSEYFGEEQVV